MEYNTTRSKMNISEYGRNIQKMIEYTTNIEDREKRNRLAKAIITMMGQLNPHLRDVNDFKHKLWDHLFIMSDFKLDVDSPYPIPSAEMLQNKPEKIKYPNSDIKFRHYGKNIELIIEKAKLLPDGEAKDNLIKTIANHMKKSYLNWNRDSVNDELITDHLELLSSGQLKLNENSKLPPTNEILARNKKKVFNRHNNTNNRNNKSNNFHNRPKKNIN